MSSAMFISLIVTRKLLRITNFIIHLLSASDSILFFLHVSLDTLFYYNYLLKFLYKFIL